MKHLVGDEWSKVEILIHLLLIMREVGEFEQALVQVNAMKDEEAKANVLSGFDQALTKQDQSRKTRGDLFGRKDMMELRQVGNELPYRDLCSAFARARIEGRKPIFDLVGEWANTLASIDQGQTLWNIFSAIEAVDSWWDSI